MVEHSEISGYEDVIIQIPMKRANAVFFFLFFLFLAIGSCGCVGIGLLIGMSTPNSAIFGEIVFGFLAIFFFYISTIIFFFIVREKWVLRVTPKGLYYRTWLNLLVIPWSDIDRIAMRRVNPVLVLKDSSKLVKELSTPMRWWLFENIRGRRALALDSWLLKTDMKVLIPDLIRYREKFLK